MHPDEESAVSKPIAELWDADALLGASNLPSDWQFGVRPGLDAAIVAVQNEPALSDEARLRVPPTFQGHLQRLQGVAADRARYPEIAAVPIDRPVFILGLPRCGTSMLHAIMAADPALRAPLMWEVA